MKKSVSIILLVLLICSVCLPLFAQQSRRVRIASPTNPDYDITIAEYEKIKAFSDGQGVFIRWEMRSEVNNLGFFVYRMGETGLEMVSPGMIMGSYSIMGTEPCMVQVMSFGTLREH